MPEFKFVTGKFPVTPPALLEAKLIVGKSAPTIALGLTAPEEPLGEAINKFALSEVPVTANVPEEMCIRDRLIRKNNLSKPSGDRKVPAVCQPALTRASSPKQYNEPCKGS